MHRTIGYISKRFVQVRPGEGRKVLLTFLYFFLIITAYYVIKPVSRSLVLGELGSRMVPYVDLICAILMGPIVTLFAKLVDRTPKPQLVSRSFWAVIGVLLVFWKLLAWHAPWIAGAFYIWVAIFSVLVVTLFWLVANDLYHPREAKRLFGFIGSGGILGGIVGSSLAAAGAHLIGTAHLLLLSIGLLVLCWLVVERLWRLAPERAAAEGQPSHPARHDTFLGDLRGFAKLMTQSRYLLLLIALVGLNKIIATLIYYQLNPFIEQAFPTDDARTAFTGMFFGGLNVVAFIVQFFFTSGILRRWGLGTALLALPVGVLGGAIGLVLVPVFWIAAATELYDGAMNYSLQQTTKEVLYLPISRSIRYKVKPFIDMVVFRFGKGLAAIIGIVLLHTLGLPERLLTYVAIPLLIAWLVVAVWLRREYVGMVRTMLQVRALARRTPEAGAAADTPSSPFGALMDGYAAGRKLAYLTQLVGEGALTPSYAQELLTHLKRYEVMDSSTNVPRDLHQLKAVIWSQQEPMPARRQAVRALAHTRTQATVDYLLSLMMVETEAVLRYEAAIGLMRLRLDDTSLEFPVKTLHRMIAREVDQYQQIADVAGILRQHHRGPPKHDDPVLGLLRILMEESVNQIFRLLILLYRPEDIHLIYDQLREPDPHLRADAIELLDNLVDPVVRAAIVPVLDEDRFLSLADEMPRVSHEPTVAYRLLQQAIWDHHCWLSVTTLCAVGRLRLTTMRPEIEKASRHAAPLISSAARVALQLAAHS